VNIYLMKDCFRIEGTTGSVVENQFASDLVKHTEQIELFAARNEYVSFQVIFDTCGKPIHHMDIDFTDLLGEEIISRDEYQVFIEWFHRINGQLIPDALVPLNKTQLEFKVPLDPQEMPDQKVGALWLDLFVPSSTPSGHYQGKIKLSVDGTQREFQIQLNVSDSVVPDESRLHADLNNYADSISPAFPHLANNPNRYKDGSFFEVEKEFYRLSYEHRCVFHNLGYKHSGTVCESFAPELEGSGANIKVKSWDLFDQHFGPYLDGSVFKGCKRGERPVEFLYTPFNFNWPSSYTKWNKKGYRTEFRRILIDFIRHFEEKGWKDTWMEIFMNHKKRYRFYPYDGDETRFAEDEAILDLYHDLCQDLIELSDTKFLLRIDSSWSYGHHFDSRFSDYIKMWVVGSGIYAYYPESAPIMHKKNNILWIYGGIGPINAGLITLFSWPVRNIMNGSRGFVFWNATGFGKDDLKTPNANGGVVVMYPGVRFGYNYPVPSIRMKFLRNSMQLADLAMTAEGTPAMRRIQNIINRHYGVDDDFWWTPKPDFINDPPHTWTNAKLSEASPLVVGKPVSPMVMEAVKKDVLDLMSGKAW
jgi:hypothetical protein